MQELLQTRAADPLENNSNYDNYKIQKDSVVFKGFYSNIFLASSGASSEANLICRIFEPTAMISANNDFYLKLLRFLGRFPIQVDEYSAKREWFDNFDFVHAGKKTHFITATWDIFFDQDKRIHLFQEYGNRGNLMEYLRAGNLVGEDQMCRWAQSTYAALDFLGSVGVLHSAIQPKHILLKAVNDQEIQAKLSGFRSASLYMDPTTGQMIPGKCRGLYPAGVKRANFMPPEWFGPEGTLYDPVAAEVWSLGATMYYALCRTYPFNLNSDNIDGEIGNNLYEGTMSDGAKSWLYHTMRGNPDDRIKFHIIAMHPWFNSV